MQPRSSISDAESPELRKRFRGATSKAYRFTVPTVEDGADIHWLVETGGTLELNSAYCYLLLGAHFADTSVIVREAGRLVGFISAYRIPVRPNALFVWQVGVAPSERGCGVASAMLDHLLDRPICGEVRYLEATVTPSNKPSRALFESFAKRRGATLAASTMFSRELFPGGQHEDEILLRVGPLDPFNKQGEAL